MTGTTVKVGFDGGDVKKGMGYLGKLFHSFGETLKHEMMVGGARRLGEKAADWVMTLVESVPDAIKELGELGKSLDEVAMQTGMTAKEALHLSEMFRLVGVEGTPGDMIVKMRKAIWEATQNVDSPQAKDLWGLGIDPQKIVNLKPYEQFREIMEGLIKMGPQWAGIEETSATLLGGKAAIKAVGAFRNVAEISHQADENIGSMGDRMEHMSKPLHEFMDALGRWPLVKASMALTLVKGFLGEENIEAATHKLNGFFNGVIAGSAKIEKFAEDMRKFFEDLSEELKGKSFMEGLETLLHMFGKWLGEGIKEGLGGIGTMLGGSTDGPHAKDTFGTFGSAASGIADATNPANVGNSWIGSAFAGVVDNLFPAKGIYDIYKAITGLTGETQDQTQVLEKIYRDGGGATFQ